LARHPGNCSSNCYCGREYPLVEGSKRGSLRIGRFTTGGTSCVSLIDLHEILETIVRIAPILVGVNRCTIYLWDETRGGFWLAQSYGLPREVEDYLTSRLYALGEYPLLDAVYENNRLVHIALEITPSQPTEWDQMIPEDVVSRQL